MSTPAYDLIGDIHGHADELKQLLKKLGYENTSRSYQHPDRTVIFLGDYIDKGPKIRDVLRIVRAMVDGGSAIALMGNHEYNALCWNIADGKGGFLRAHTPEKQKQHQETLGQFQTYMEEWNAHLAWFRTLPFFHEHPTFRAVHACWDDRHIALLRNELRSGLTDEFLRRSEMKGTALFEAVEHTLKGKELQLPDPHFFLDKYEQQRKEVRIRWWEDPEGSTYREYSVHRSDEIPEVPVVDRRHADGFIYGAHERPVFFGHYWLEHPHPAIMRGNICCLDHSVAKKGHLAAYRFDEEQLLDERKLVFVEAKDRAAAGSTS